MVFLPENKSACKLAYSRGHDVVYHETDHDIAEQVFFNPGFLGSSGKFVGKTYQQLVLAKPPGTQRKIN